MTGPNPPDPNSGPWIEGEEIACPECGRPMKYRHWGWHWDGSPAYSWHCTGSWNHKDQPPCWKKVFDGEPPWTIAIHQVPGAWLAYLEQYHQTPIDTQRPPEDLALQPRLFL
jgi:hypothetical protein